MNKNGRPDARPDPKPRKHAALWQTYLQFDELIRMRTKHLNRISAVEKGKSNFDAQLEYDFLQLLQLDQVIKTVRKTMVNYASTTGAIWDWITSIRGLKEGSLAAGLLAQIDDISKFATVSKLWAFSGYKVVDGKADKGSKGEQGSGGNRRLKSIAYLIVDQFIKQQTNVYVDIYYDEKLRLRKKFPEKIKDENGKWKYNDGHIHNMAMRKVAKIFLQHVWLVWRMAERLEISQPYIHDIGGHTNIVQPPNLEVIFNRVPEVSRC
jgi:hypothetical protein